MLLLLCRLVEPFVTKGSIATMAVAAVQTQVLGCIHGARPANLDPDGRVVRVRADRLLRRGRVPNPLPSPEVTETEATTAAPGTASPSASDTASGTASPQTASASPTSSDTASPATPGATPSGTVLPASCSSVTPVRVARVDTGPRRTTEVVSVVSDGRNLTSGTREQSDFLTPEPDRTGPDGGDR